MATKYLIASIFFTATFLSACKKDNLSIQEGTYKGIFTVTYNSVKESGKTTLELKNGRFSCSGNPNRIPAGGSGTFSYDENTITFNDENAWTADFDWNLILNGKYYYTFDGKKLIFSSDKNNMGNYKYDLKKQ